MASRVKVTLNWDGKKIVYPENSIAIGINFTVFH